MDPKQERKKRKWDVPGTVPALQGAMAPSILGQPFIGGAGNVVGGLGKQLGQPYPQMGLAQILSQGGPVGMPNPAAAEEVRRKINQTLIQRGIIAGPKEDDAGEKEIVINDSPPAIRSQLTRRPVQEEIQRETGSVITTRGRYKPPGAPLDPTEKPLHLHISAGAHLPNPIAKQRAVEHAASIIEDILKGGPGLRPRQGLVRPPVAAMHTLFLHVGIEADAGFGLSARIRGPNNAYLDHISNESAAVLELRGRGSGTKEGPEGKEKDEPLQLVLMCSTASGLDQAKKLANNLLDTIRADWETHSKPAVPAVSAPPAAPQYPPYYYGYPYPPYPGAPPPYGAAPPYFGYYPPPGPGAAAQAAGGAEGAGGGGGGPQAPQMTSTPLTGDHYQQPQQTPAPAAAAAYPGATPQPAAAAPSSAQPAAGYTPAPYVPPMEDKKGIPPPPPDSRPAPPQSPAQTIPSPNPYHYPQQQQQQHQHQQATFSPPPQYAPPDSYPPQRHPAAPQASSVPPPPTEATPPPPPEAVPPPPSEEAPPAPPQDTTTTNAYQAYQYPTVEQQQQPTQQTQTAPQYGQQQQQANPPYAQHYPQYPQQEQQTAEQGHYPTPTPTPGAQDHYSAAPLAKPEVAPNHYSTPSGAYQGPGASASVYSQPVNNYAAYPPTAHAVQAGHTTQLPTPKQPQQTSVMHKPSPAEAYAPQGYTQSHGQYQQMPASQQGSYTGGAYNSGYTGPGGTPVSGYQTGGAMQRPPLQQHHQQHQQQQHQQQHQQAAPEGEKKRKFQEFPTNGRGMPPPQLPKAPFGLAPPGAQGGYGMVPPVAPSQGTVGGAGRGLMGPPPPRAVGQAAMRGTGQPMGPPPNRPSFQSAQPYGVKLVDYGEEEDDEASRGNTMRPPPHLQPQGAQGVPRPFWRPRG